jgi:hypothetical protein
VKLFCLIPGLLLVASLMAPPARSAEPDSVSLALQPALGLDLAAFPRIAPADGAASERINQALTSADTRARAADSDCRADAHEAQADPKDAGWQRTVTVAMRGPGYLSLVASDNWFCGGPYPSAAIFALAYDLRTGAPLNWERLLPKTLVGKASLDTAGDGTRLGVVESPALKALYVKLAKPDTDCAPVLRDSALKFMLWPDAARAGIAVQPTDLPHVVAACATDVVIPLATLRTLGADAALLGAIAAAHAAGLFDKTP